MRILWQIKHWTFHDQYSYGEHLEAGFASKIQAIGMSSVFRELRGMLFSTWFVFPQADSRIVRSLIEPEPLWRWTRLAATQLVDGTKVHFVLHGKIPR